MKDVILAFKIFLLILSCSDHLIQNVSIDLYSHVGQLAKL